MDPALAALHHVLSDERVDSGVRVRAALGILDRTGFKPGMTIEVGLSRFDGWLAAAVGMDPETGQIDLDRGLPGAAEHPALPAGDHTWEDVESFAKDAQQEAWREYDREDEEPYLTRLDPYDGRTIKGEVLPGPFPAPPPTGPSEYDRRNGSP